MEQSLAKRILRSPALAALALFLGARPAHAIAPIHNGFYEIELKCATDRIPCNMDSVASLDALTIIDSFERTGLTLTFVSRRDGFSAFSIVNAKVSDDGSAIEGYSSMYSSVPRFLRISFDTKTGDFTGTLEDTHSSGGFILRGRPVRWLGDLLKTAVPATDVRPEHLVGEYRTRIGRVPGTLVMKYFDERFVASFLSDEWLDGRPVLTLNFQNGAWTPELGLLRLASANVYEESTFGSMALVFRRGSSPERLVFDGFELMGFVHNPITLTR